MCNKQSEHRKKLIFIFLHIIFKGHTITKYNSNK